MADFDLSLLATMDGASVVSENDRIAASIDKVANAETKAAGATKKSAQAADATARAEREKAEALKNVLGYIDPTYAAQQRLNKVVADAEKLYKQGAISAADYAKVQKLSAEATKRGAQSAGQARAAYTQLGFQIQDITQSLALGVNPMVVFGQQAGQTAAAVAGMGGKIGAVGAFLAGPFGSIILGAVTVLGMLATQFLLSGKEAENADKKHRTLTETLLDAKASYEEVIAALREYNDAQRQSQQITLNGLKIQAEAIRKNLQEAVSIREKAKAELDRIGAFSTDPTFAEGNLAYAGMMGQLDTKIKQQDAKIAELRAAAGNTTVQVADRVSAVRGSREELIREGFALLREEARNNLSGQKLIDRYTELRKREDAALANVRKKGGSTRSDRSGERAVRETERLAKFGDDAAEAIARINSRFDEQPKLIDQAAQAGRELDSIIADLEKRKPIGWEKMVADAQAAKQVIADALVRPFDDLIEASERRMTIDRLIAANREDEAAALQQIWQLEARIGPLTNERKEAILDQIIAERELSEELAKREVFLSAYLDATRSIRGEIEAILSGTGKLSNLGTALKQLRGKILFERMFGDAFRDLEKFIKKENAVETSVDIMTTQTERAGRSAGSLADELDGASRRIANVGTPGAVGGQGAFEQAFGDDFLEQLKVGQDAQAKSDDIVVSAIKSGVNNLEPERYFDELGKTIVGPLLDGFDELFGTQFFSRLQGVFSGALSGYLTAGPAGGIIGALQGIKGLPEGISSALGKAMGGAQTGTMVAGLGNMLGIGMSSTGAQIGGAIGSMLPIPGGQIIGSIAGGLIGKLFGKTKYGTASVSSVDDLSVTSRGKGRSEGATSLGNSVQDGLRNIADALGADIGRFNVSIGTYKDSFRVSTTGRTGKLKAKYSDVTDFGDDEAAALAFALADAIGDGAIQGVSDAVQKALRSDSDIEKAVQEALKVKDLEDAIKYLGDDIGKAFDDFAKVAKDRLDLARKYGVDLVKVEELNAIERQKLIDDAIERQVGSLKSLLDDLNFGALFEGSPMERRDRLLREIADAQQDVDAGVDGAIDRLADLQRQLVETSRAAFGTAGTEYAADREQAATAAQAIIEAETARIEAAAAKADESLTLQSETNDLLADANGRLDTLINLVGRGALLNFGTVIENGGIGEIRIPAISY